MVCLIVEVRVEVSEIDELCWLGSREERDDRNDRNEAVVSVVSAAGHMRT